MTNRVHLLSLTSTPSNTRVRHLVVYFTEDYYEIAWHRQTWLTAALHELHHADSDLVPLVSCVINFETVAGCTAACLCLPKYLL